jgi:hypothetical protein
VADHFEKAKDEILLKTDGNGGPTNRDMLKAMGALALDVDEAIDGLDKKNKARHDETLKVLDMQGVEITCCQEDIDVLEKWRTESSLTCVSKVREIAAEVAADLHGPTHERHLLEHHNDKPQSGVSPLGRDYADPSDSQFGEHRESAHPPEDEELGDLRRFWRTFKWFVITFGVAVLVMLADQLGNIIFGGPT